MDRPDSAPGMDLPFERIGAFRLVRLLGEGGMSRVFEAVQEKPFRTVAIKLMREAAFSETALNRFDYEGRILAGLQHPGIARVIEAGTHLSEGGPIPYLVMEFIPDAKAITDYARSLSLSLEERLALFVRLCESVHYGHTRGVIHRDLKPGNVLVDDEGRVKIIDFGVARTTDPDAEPSRDRTSTGQLVGTLQYMSPEQCEADPEQLDIRSDVYALGVLLFELLTDAMPYDLTDLDLVESARAIQSAPPKKPSSIRKQLKGDLDVILLKALEKDRNLRYQSVLDLKDDIVRHLSGDVIFAQSAGPMTRAVKFIKRNPLACASGGLAAFSLAAWIVYILFWSLPQLEFERDEAQKEKERAEAATRQVEEHLQQIRRLSDRAILNDLKEREYTLWPALPEQVAGYETWLDEAEQLLGRLDLHKETLVKWQEKALPFDEAAQKKYRESHPLYPELVSSLAEMDRLEAALSELSDGKPGEEQGEEPGDENAEESSEEQDDNQNKQQNEELDTARQQLKEKLLFRRGMLKNQIKKLESEFSKVRRVWDFEEISDRWQYEQLATLVEEIESHVAMDSEMRGEILVRLDQARAVEKESIEDARAEWDRAIQSIADPRKCPRYEGLQIEPVIGFVPLGRNPDSGLWEFFKLYTGDRPERDENGGYVLTEDTGMVFVLIPGGTMKLGSSSSDLGDFGKMTLRYDGEGRVKTIDPFLLSKYEMTQAQWKLICKNNPSEYYPGEKFGTWHTLMHPVERVSWDECARTLFLMDLRLPDEAEWEYAARAGEVTPWFTGAEKETLDGFANICDRSKKERMPNYQEIYEEWLNDGFIYSAPIGVYEPNAFGLHDIHGNVWEWCRDHYSEGADGLRTCRGGGHHNMAMDCRLSIRLLKDPGLRRGDSGLRPARSLK